MRKSKAGVQRRPDVTDKLVILYATWNEDLGNTREDMRAYDSKLVAMGRSEEEMTDNLALWFLGVTEDQKAFDDVMGLLPAHRWPYVVKYMEQHAEGELTRDAYTLGTQGR